jgi:phosphatidylinositol 4-phosphatase
MNKFSMNPVVGPLVGTTRHERGKSDARLLGLEEGKTRIE